MTTLPCALATATSAVAEPRTGSQESGIRRAALDYIEGWYSGDATRMESALHPELAKRIIRRTPGRPAELQHMGALTLVQRTRSRASKASGGRAEVTVLDVYEGAASVRVDAHAWIDYLHLAEVDGRWQIVNVLWELRPGA